MAQNESQNFQVLMLSEQANKKETDLQNADFHWIGECYKFFFFHPGKSQKLLKSYNNFLYTVSGEGTIENRLIANIPGSTDVKEEKMKHK